METWRWRQRRASAEPWEYCVTAQREGGKGEASGSLTAARYLSGTGRSVQLCGELWAAVHHMKAKNGLIVIGTRISA